MDNYLLGWKLEFQIENQQSCSKASGGGGSSLGWNLPVPTATRGWNAASGQVGHGTLQHQPGLTVNSLGENPVFGMCALTESGVLVQGGFPHCRGRSSSLVLLTVPSTFPFSQQEQEEEAQLCLSSGPLLSRFSSEQTQAWPSSEQQGSNLAAQLTSFEVPSKKKKV